MAQGLPSPIQACGEMPRLSLGDSHHSQHFASSGSPRKEDRGRLDLFLHLGCSSWAQNQFSSTGFKT